MVETPSHRLPPQNLEGEMSVLGGYFLLDSDGSALWEKKLGSHMDSVAILPWDSGRMRARMTPVSRPMSGIVG